MSQKDTAPPPDRFNFARHLIETNAGRAAKTALIDDAGQLSYGQLADQVQRCSAALTALGHRLMAGLALSLDLKESYFADRISGEPLTLFRIFNYPPPADTDLWGVGEHTDYGLESRSRWVPAPPVPGSFVCNLGDMLDRMTGGLYRSTPHRVRNPAPRDRLSFPLFFDPGFDARVQPIPGLPERADDRASRWDGESVHAFDGTYGEYLVAKVSRVFPQLSGGLA